MENDQTGMFLSVLHEEIEGEKISQQNEEESTAKLFWLNKGKKR